MLRRLDGETPEQYRDRVLKTNREHTRRWRERQKQLSRAVGVAASLPANLRLPETESVNPTYVIPPRLKSPNEKRKLDELIALARASDVPITKCPVGGHLGWRPSWLQV